MKLLFDKRIILLIFIFILIILFLFYNIGYDLTFRTVHGLKLLVLLAKVQKIRTEMTQLSLYKVGYLNMDLMGERHATLCWPAAMSPIGAIIWTRIMTASQKEGTFSLRKMLFHEQRLAADEWKQIYVFS